LIRSFISITSSSMSPSSEWWRRQGSRVTLLGCSREIK